MKRPHIAIGSLFSGIDGLSWGIEEGLHDAGLPASTAFQIECNPYALAVLEREWPRAVRRTDVRTATARNLPGVHVVVGGSPCQDLSFSGKRAGLSGARSGLWYEYARLVGELRPAAVVWENVGGALCPTRDQSSGARIPAPIAHVIRDLDTLGYDALWTVLGSALVGAPHLRARVFVLAWRRDGALPLANAAPASTHRAPLDLSGRSWPAPPDRRAHAWEPPREVPHVRDIPYHQERIEALGNTVQPQVAYVVGRMLAVILGAPAPSASSSILSPRAMGARAAAWTRALLTDRLELRPWGSVQAEAWPTLCATPGTRARRAVASPLCRSWPAAGLVRNGHVLAATDERSSLQVAQCATGGACEGADPVDARAQGFWPTATARDYRSGKASAATRARQPARPLNETAAPNGFLVPEWVELLLGFPEGYTRVDRGAPAQRKRGSKPCP